jgi:hypothetical protein
MLHSGWIEIGAVAGLYLLHTWRTMRKIGGLKPREDRTVRQPGAAQTGPGKRPGVPDFAASMPHTAA